MTEFAAFIPKTYNYLADNNDGNKKATVAKSVIKVKLKLEDYKHCFEATQ